MTDVIKKSLTELRAALQKSLGDNMLEVRLFGSRARGDAHKYSDVNIFLLVRRRSKKLREKVIDVAAELSLKYELVISPTIMTPAQLADEKDMETLRYHDITNHGIVI